MTAEAYFKTIKDERSVWRSRFSRCMWCGGSDILDVHEICPRSLAPKAYGDTCNYLLLGGSLSPCNCHGTLFSSMKPARQLAVKVIRDPSNFHLERWLRLSDSELKAPFRVTQEEVDEEAKELRLMFAKQTQKGMRF